MGVQFRAGIRIIVQCADVRDRLLPAVVPGNQARAVGRLGQIVKRLGGCLLLGVGMGMISCCSPAVLGNLMMDIMPGMLGTEQGSTAEERDVRRAQMIQNTIS